MAVELNFLGILEVLAVELDLMHQVDQEIHLLLVHLKEIQVVMDHLVLQCMEVVVVVELQLLEEMVITQVVVLEEMEVQEQLHQYQVLQLQEQVVAEVVYFVNQLLNQELEELVVEEMVLEV